ncbi:hypothetical protein V6N12_067876 [Hibiscus sabdariffa]|uniref:Uncharacterized protein n=1 Tax=Hibiscus sabdariffa TaxID=183260 RepID=A0ABR2FNZ1_9ROSI
MAGSEDLSKAPAIRVEGPGSERFDVMFCEAATRHVVEDGGVGVCSGTGRRGDGEGLLLDSVLELDSTSNQNKEFDFIISNSNYILDFLQDMVDSNVHHIVLDNIDITLITVSIVVSLAAAEPGVEIVISKGVARKV